ncbi:MAG TPA: cytochrome c oxidase assembly factor Coa1 family protein [Bryobacteraceae bacterium]|nr:cytochrome c oxidase assembly factor Coa1 family protein [Bryobacteraceae bacterium]
MATYPSFGPPRKSWFQRHLGLTIAGGCTALLLAVVLFVSMMVLLVFGLLRKSDAAKLAIARAESNVTVQRHIGRKLEAGLFVSGNVKINGPSGHAELQIPVHGEKGKGTIYAAADKRAGLWIFSNLEVAFDDGAPRVDLLQEPREVVQ